jgi:MFS family permease
VPALLLACLTYLGVALPASTLGLLWPSMRLSFGEPVGALGFLLVFGVIASVMASAATGRILSRVRVGPVVALGTLLSALALAAEALAPALWVFTAGIVVFGVGFGLIDSALNAHAASHFGARDVNWMHASYGLGAIVGPLLVTALLSDGITWRWAYGTIAVTQVAVACVLTVARRNWGTDPVCSRPAPVAPEPAARPRRRKPAPGVVLTALAFTAAETGIESGAGIWGYIFLTAGRGLQRDAAGVAVSAYWATMFLGRVILGPAAERIGPARVLAGAVAGVPAGADLSAAHPHHSATGRGRRFYRNDTGGEPPGSRVGPRRGRGACRPWAGHRIVRCQDPGPAAAGPRPGDGHPLRALVTDRIVIADGRAARG